jgi:NHL repeat
MTAKHIKTTVLPLTFAIVTMLAGVASAHAEAPVKLILSSHIGWEVNKLTKENYCTEATQGECQPGKSSSEPGGFEFPESVAVAADGDIYVTDELNKRVQELTPTGGFVLMFGEEVNATTLGDICTEEEIKTSKVTCKAGIPGTTADAFAEPQGIAIDPTTGNIYVEDYGSERIDEYTPNGSFVLTIGKEVNETEDDRPGATETQKNLCTAISKDTCKAGVRAGAESTERGAFNFVQLAGDMLSVGGAPEHLLYIGDQSRVQEYNAAGEWKGEQKLKPNVTAVAVDDETGALYVVYNHEPVIHEVNGTSGEELKEFEVPPRKQGRIVAIAGIALDPSGRLAVLGPETLFEEGQFGYLYIADTGRLLTGFTVPGTVGSSGTKGIRFGANGELYAAVEAGAPQDQELLRYVPEPVAELLTTNAVCKTGTPAGTSVTFDCALNGEVNPFGVAGTEVFFEWGKTPAFGSHTSTQPVTTGEALEGVSIPVDGLRPNETFYDRLAGYDENVQAPEQLTSETTKLTTQTVPPRIVGAPSASFVTASSAVLFGELNPENTTTTYTFQYAKACAPETACPGIAQTPGMAETASQTASAYGNIGATFEARGLQPQTTYRYRLIATNQPGEAALNETGGNTLPEGTFTTGGAAVPQATSGTASAVAATSATISGSVDPDGLAATYSFEVGVYEGANTRYGVVFSGPAGTASTPTEETYGLTGLEPGTEYAYRIAIHSGYIDNGENTLQGAPVLFTTAGIPSVLFAPAPLALLAVPGIVFPQPVVSAPKPKAKPETTAQKLAAALAACHKDKQAGKRTSCERAAHRKFAAAKPKAKHK